MRNPHMPRCVSYLVPVTVGVLLLVGAACEPSRDYPAPPPTRVEQVVETLHGVEVSDPYRWLEQADSAEVQAWIQAQNAYGRSIMESLPEGEQTRERLTHLLRQDNYASPLTAAGRYFFTMRSAMADQAIIAMREGVDGEDIPLIDPQAWEDLPNARVRLRGVSADGRLLVYTVGIPGQEDSTVRFFDTTTKRDHSDSLPEARYTSLSLLPDGSGLYYVLRADNRESVRFHRLGSNPSSDRPLPGLSLKEDQAAQIHLSTDARQLVVRVFDGTVGETSIFLWDRRTRASRTLVDQQKANFVARVTESQVYMATNWQAPEGRVLVTSLRDLSPDSWQELIPARPGQVLEELRLAGGKLFLRYLKDVQSRIVSFSAEGEELGEIRFAGIGSVSAVRGRWDSPEAFFTFESFHIPRTIYRLDTQTSARTIWAQPDTPVDPDNYHVQQKWFRSKDGTEVPIFVVHRKGAHLDGTNHMVLAGFGSFGVSVTPAYSASAVTWLDDGGMFAIACLRGGGEYGEMWHEAAKGANKQTTVDDLIAAADWLIREGYTRPESLALEGNGAGGLAVAAAMVQRPELAKTIVLAVPLLDMVRYHKSPNAARWNDEFGNADDPQQFEHLYRLSPYHRVDKETVYPGAYLISGSIDAGIDPMHALKMTARLQAQKDATGPVILRYYDPSETEDRQLEQAIDELTNAQLFLRWQLGDLEIER